MRKNLNPDRYAWFNQARFGMFIHWGLYSVSAHGEWAMYKEQIPLPEYMTLRDSFLPPATFSPALWARLAKQAGCGYVVLTTRHHDGFCLFDSPVSDYNSVKSRAGRDFVREFAEACRAEGLRVGFYYSLIDWRFPGAHQPAEEPASLEAMVRQLHDQVRELLTQYGRVDLLWYDGGNLPSTDPETAGKIWRAQELNAMARRLMPGILINDRSNLAEDFSTPEQHAVAPPAGRAWEACMTLNGNWGYHIADRNFKSLEELHELVVHCAQFGGNLLLNIGPRADGSVQPECIERLRGIGAWLKTNGEAIYDSERSWFTEEGGLYGPISARGDTIYLHLHRWPEATAVVGGLANRALAARLLGSAKGLKVTSTKDGRIEITGLPAKRPEGLDRVLAVELDGPPTRRAGALATVLTEPDTGHYAPAKGRVLGAAALAAAAGTLRDSRTFCPSWSDTPVLAARDGKLRTRLTVPCAGRWQLRLGHIAAAAGTIALAGLPGKSATRITVATGGYPETTTLPPLILPQGELELKLQAPFAFGLYGVALDPVLQPLGPESWAVIGPFPTAWQPLGANAAVAAALKTVFPPETNPDLGARHVGVSGKPLCWQAKADGELGGHDDGTGVNLVARCGREHSGVFYAQSWITVPTARDVLLYIGCDWWATAFVNGVEVTSDRAPEAVAADGAAFNGWKPYVVRVRLKTGRNRLLVKAHRGTGGAWFSAWLTDPGDVKTNAT